MSIASYVIFRISDNMTVRYVDPVTSVDLLGSSNTVPPIACLLEEPLGGSDEKVKISLISVCCATGDVVWDSFDGKI